jgi:microcystin-dependent protein
MSCDNCFNGCNDISPDKCIKYTGPTISSLDITSGDTMQSVIGKITTNLITSLDGTGVVPIIDDGIICSLLSPYLPPSGTITIVDYTVALILGVCNLQEQVTVNTDALTTLNANYTISCLEGVSSSTDTHDIVQAIITKLCSLNTSFSALVANLPSTYVSLSNLNTLIQAYLDDISSATAVKNKMVPYAAVEYYGPLTYFDLTGAGTGDWEEIYLCNGNNGTPDKRGRVAVGTTIGMGGGAFSATVDPGIAGNPNYALYGTGGDNTIVLTQSHMPAHSHSTSVSLTDPSHFHYVAGNTRSAGSSGLVDVSASTYVASFVDSGVSDNYKYQFLGTSTAASIGRSSVASTGITASVTNPSVGGGTAHSNIQPVLACHYIIHIPS